MSQRRDCQSCGGHGHHENPDEEEAAFNPMAVVTCYACGGTGKESSMTQTPKIVRAQIRAHTPTDPPCNGNVGVYVEYDDGSAACVVGYYSDELHFTADEFIGLTREQAQDLHRKRDIAYLQS